MNSLTMWDRGCIYYVYTTTVDVKLIDELMVQRTNKTWSDAISSYVKFKQSFRKEEYINIFMSRRQRSLLV